jgi:hypothetical protein
MAQHGVISTGCSPTRRPHAWQMSVLRLVKHMLVLWYIYVLVLGEEKRVFSILLTSLIVQVKQGQPAGRLETWTL